MKESNANLETSAPNNQANSQPDNKSAEPNGKVPDKQQVATEPKKPRGLAELFADPTDESSTEISLDDDSPDDPNSPLDSIERLIKRNKLTPEQAYAIKVPMPNGAEPLTIGELKDKVGELTDFELKVTEFDERRIKQQGDILKSQAELKGILEMLPKDALSEGVLKKVRERQEITTRRERQLTLEHIPEWRNEKVREAELEGINEMLSDYGFDETFLPTIIDHRAMMFVRDAFRIRSRIKKSLEAVRDPKKLGKGTSGKSNKAAAKPAAETQTRRTRSPTQRDRIVELFKSKE